MGRIIVIAIGGNAILGSKGAKSHDDYALMDKVVNDISKIYRRGDRIVITHGNGPQVGTELRRGEAANREVKELKLHDLIAETQSLIGTAIERRLMRSLARHKKKCGVAVILTHVAIDSKGSSRAPSKPIGPYISKSEMEKELKMGHRGYVEKDGMFRITA